MSHIAPYKNESLKTFEKIHPYNIYETNKVYKESGNRFFYYINSKGYLHALKPEKAKFNGKLIYCIIDYRLNADNTLTETDRQFCYEIESFKARLEELENKAKEGIAK